MTENTETTETNPEYPEYKMSAGGKSLTQFLVIIGTVAPMLVWQSSLPPAGGDGDGSNFLMGFLMFLLWFPLLIASLCYGLIAIVDNNGRTKGIITLSCITALVLWAIIDITIHSS